MRNDGAHQLVVPSNQQQRRVDVSDEGVADEVESGPVQHPAQLAGRQTLRPAPGVPGNPRSVLRLHRSAHVVTLGAVALLLGPVAAPVVIATGRGAVLVAEGAVPEQRVHDGHVGAEGDVAALQVRSLQSHRQSVLHAYLSHTNQSHVPGAHQPVTRTCRTPTSHTYLVHTNHSHTYLVHTNHSHTYLVHTNHSHTYLSHTNHSHSDLSSVHAPLQVLLHLLC